MTHFEVNENLIRIDYKGHSEGKIEVSALKPDKTYKLSGSARNGFPVLQKSNEKGVLSLGGVQTGTIEISWQ